MLSRARGLAPKGFSFDASLMMSVRPSSRCSSSMGLPGTYGDSERTLSTASWPGSDRDMGRILAGRRLTLRASWPKHPRMNRRLLAVLAVSACFHTAAFGSELPDYVRYAENKHSARLEVAI